MPWVRTVASRRVGRLGIQALVVGFAVVSLSIVLRAQAGSPWERAASSLQS